ncbi:MAG: zinc-ribbon domain containing protein [Pseudomonadota bacterium]
MSLKAKRRQLRRTSAKVVNWQRLDCSKAYVRHPRYGCTPLLSNDPDAQTAARKHFRGNFTGTVPGEVWAGRTYFYPDSAIRVRIPESDSTFWSTMLCMDRGERCRTCGRWYLFWALEQKHWHEVLKFGAWAGCLDCCDCRRERHQKERLVQEYEDLLARDGKTNADWARFSLIGDRLFEIGYIKHHATLAKTRMPKRLRGRVS